MKKPFILSTDIGTDIDDAVALYLAMNSEAIDLKGVYVTNGPVEHRAKIAKHMVDLAGHDALVAVGEGKAVYTKFPVYTTGAEKAAAPRKATGMETDWLAAMVKQLNEFPGMIVGSIAPLTNIARLLEQASDAVAKIGSLYIMGGREGHNEHNFSHDSKAAERVIRSDIPLVIVPADVCRNYEIEIEFLTGLAESRTQRYLARMARMWELYKNQTLVFDMDFQRMVKNELKHDHEFIQRIKDHGERLKEFDVFQRFQMLTMWLCNSADFSEEANWQLEILETFLARAEKLKDREYARTVLEHYEEKRLRHVLVSDAFVIYAIEHPERVKEEKVDIECDELGTMTTRRGGRHRMVVDLDYKHFEAFLKRRLEQRQPREKIKHTVK